MRRIYSTRTGLEAHDVRLFLESQGVPSKVFGDNNALEVGFALTPATEPGVFVEEADVERAAGLLEVFLARPQIQGTRAEWKCAVCGETCEEQFDLCWNCESPRTKEAAVAMVTASSESSPISDATVDDNPAAPSEEAAILLTRSKWHMWLEVVVVLAITQPYFLSSWVFSPISNLWTDTTFAGRSGWTITTESIISGFMILLIAWSGEPWSKFGIYWPRPLWDFFGAGLLYLLTTRIASIGNGLLIDVLKEWFRSNQLYDLLRDSCEWLAPHGGAELVVALVTSFCIGFSEELVFRGYLIPRFEQLLHSTWLSVLLTSILFALVHLYLGVDGVWNVFLIGFVFGAMFAYFRRLWPIVIAHAMIDFVVMLRIGFDLS
jgi:membrane protease YdiL (CAAX protease family)